MKQGQITQLLDIWVMDFWPTLFVPYVNCVKTCLCSRLVCFLSFLFLSEEVKSPALMLFQDKAESQRMKIRLKVKVRYHLGKLLTLFEEYADGGDGNRHPIQNTVWYIHLSRLKTQSSQMYWNSLIDIYRF